MIDLPSHDTRDTSPESIRSPGTFGFFSAAAQSRFGPDFDDRVFDPEVPLIPVVVPVPTNQGVFTVSRRASSDFTVFGRQFHSSRPIEVTVLSDRRGNVWMSDPPQERMMMHASAMRSRGSVLVGGLGLGIFPQYAAAVDGVTRFTIVERSVDVIALVEPILRRVLPVPFNIVHQPIETYLSECADRFDTIFLDTWETLEPRRLPTINTLRHAAAACLTPGGRVLLWGYLWMVEMFVEACVRFFSFDLTNREAMLAQLAERDAASADLLRKVERHFRFRPGMEADLIHSRAQRIARRITA